MKRWSGVNGTPLGNGYVGRRKEIKNAINVSSKNIATVQATIDGKKITAAWARTTAEGLYSLSIADLAAAMNKSEKAVRNRAKKGRLIITNDYLPVVVAL